ncbi:MAG: hypothetical protein FJ265_18040 [Planctomycetes bacterium]|nr:hypothetical protein [Planctomycetota bacterium]
MTQPPLLSLGLFALPLLAQGPGGPGNPPPVNARTVTNYAVFATDGTNASFRGLPANAPVGPGINLNAFVGGGPNVPPAAVARTSVMPVATMQGAGLRIVETARIHGTDPNANYACGTSRDAPNTTAPVQGSHTVGVHYAVPANATGTVSINWMGQASGGATSTGAVDVDGDGVADWTGTAGTNNQTTLPVTAGQNGVLLAITTNGGATVTGVGDAGYNTTLVVTFRPTGGGPGTVTVTWTSYGPQCLGSLTGTDSQQNGVLTLNLALAGAPANGFGILVGGVPATTPVPLPFGTCQLLVDPNGAGGGLRSFLTDASGAAAFVYRLRAVAFTMDFQAITFGFDVNNNSVLGSSNALNMTAQ